MVYKIISSCPVCNNKLKATRLKCKKCNTVIDNEFNLSKFDYLNQEQLYFIETFVRCRGSIKEVEKELGISYPTVRTKLDEVIEALGYKTRETRKQKDKSDILEALEKGEISPDEAIMKLKD